MLVFSPTLVFHLWRVHVCLRCCNVWGFYLLLSPFPAAGVLLTVFWCYSRPLTQPKVIWFVLWVIMLKKARVWALRAWCPEWSQSCLLPLCIPHRCLFSFPLTHARASGVLQLVHLFPSRALGFQHHHHPCMSFFLLLIKYPPNMSLYTSVSSLLFPSPSSAYPPTSLHGNNVDWAYPCSSKHLFVCCHAPGFLLAIFTPHVLSSPPHALLRSPLLSNFLSTNEMLSGEECLFLIASHRASIREGEIALNERERSVE